MATRDDCHRLTAPTQREAPWARGPDLSTNVVICSKQDARVANHSPSSCQGLPRIQVRRSQPLPESMATLWHIPGLGLQYIGLVHNLSSPAAQLSPLSTPRRYDFSILKAATAGPPPCKKYGSLEGTILVSSISHNYNYEVRFMEGASVAMVAIELEDDGTQR